LTQIEGRRPVIEALKAHRKIDEILIASGAKVAGSLAEIVRLAERSGVRVREVPRKELEQRAKSRNAQGVIARSSASTPSASLEGVLASADGPVLLVALDGVTDPQNLGAIARSAEAAGAHALIVPKRRSAGIGPGAEKASAGALEHIPVVGVANLAQTVETLKERGVWIAALDANAKTTIYDLDGTDPLCLVIGGEGAGVSRLVLDRADHRVSIPMAGRVGSLNASAAAAVALFEVRRQRR
jgi:23S rRNA (guanosine2251-2'-O)-methyltransferase